MFVDQCSGRFKDIVKKVEDADFVAINYYADELACSLIGARCATQKPWCFWGERPGMRKPEWLGRLRRRVLLRDLYGSQAPIWGIGRFAVEGYKAEFGNSRLYDNIPYYSDLDRFQQAGVDRNSLNDERVFLFSGSLIYRKGVDLLAQSFLRLAREVTNIRLIVVGYGKSRDWLVRLLQPVRDRVEFLGFKDWQELPACYGHADVLCVPSRYDGWGLVVPEGLAAGLPVIGTNRMGAAIEFIETGRNGWLIPADNENALFVAMREAALLPKQKLAQMSDHARKSVAEHTLDSGALKFISAAKGAVASWESESENVRNSWNSRDR